MADNNLVNVQTFGLMIALIGTLTGGVIPVNDTFLSCPGLD